jgi:ABC-type transport system involved in multi-copper enzyme maturation permease subunit
MLWKLLNFEFKLHTRQIGFWVAAFILAALAVLFISTDFFAVSTTGERLKSNGALTIAVQIGFLSLLSLFFGAVYVVTGYMRDDTSKATEYIHAMPVSTFDMVVSRMVGVCLAIFLVVFAGVVGLFVGQFAPWGDAESLGPPNPLYFIYAILVFLIPNTIIVGGLFTLVAGLTRNRTIVYVSAVGLFVLYIMAGLLPTDTTPKLILSLVDPFGITAAALDTVGWPAAEQNTNLPPLRGYLGLNRLVWSAIGLGVFYASFRMFKRGIVAGNSKAAIVDDKADSAVEAHNIVPALAPGRGGFGAFFTRFKYEYVTTVRSVAFLILMALAVALFALVLFVTMTLSATGTILTNSFMAGAAFASLLFPLQIAIIFFSGEIVWRDKTHGFSEILDATPVRNWPLMLGKWAGLAGMLITVVLAATLVGIIAQLILSDVPINLKTHLTLPLVDAIPDLLLSVALVMFVQNFMPNQIAGMVGSAIALGVFSIGIFFVPFFHPLMGYGSVPLGGFSEINGIGNILRYKWFLLYWGSLAALFAVVSIWFWRRGTQSSLLSRFRGLGKRITLLSGAAAAIFGLGFVGAGATIYNGYNVKNDYTTTSETRKRRIRLEQEFGHLLDRKVPKIRAVVSHVDLRPRTQTATSTGHFVVENTTQVPLEDLFLTVPVDAAQATISIQGASWNETIDGADVLKDIRGRMYAFETPVPVGGRFRVDFSIEIKPPELGNASPIRRNGTFVDNNVLMPGLDVPDFRLVNQDRRRRAGLEELDRFPDRDNEDALQTNFFTESADYVDFEASVCTDIGQIPIAPGKLERAYEKDGRACRDYKVINPIALFFSYLSARYEVAEAMWENPEGDDVALEIFYHAEHDYNVELMLAAMKQSLDTYTETFGPYQYSQVRIMEFPYGGFAQAFAGTIPFSENIGFVMDSGDPEDNTSVDTASFVTMHEIGHQWFGHQILPARVKGFNVLSEGLTMNASQTAYEDAFGWQKARRLLEQRSITGYLTGRTFDSNDEPPLAKATGQQYLDYEKANWVFWGLKHYIGEDEMQGAIRDFVYDFGSKGPPYPTTANLVDYLRDAAGEDYQQLMTDYWDRIVFWDLKFMPDTLSVKRSGSGGYNVAFTLRTDKRIASEENGKETSVDDMDLEDFDEWIEIGFYDKNPADTLGDEWLKLERIHITELETELSFDLETEPTHVMLDPRRLLIERNVTDNASEVSLDG